VNAANPLWELKPLVMGGLEHAATDRPRSTAALKSGSERFLAVSTVFPRPSPSGGDFAKA
jgi:hypothetical protein